MVSVLVNLLAKRSSLVSYRIRIRSYLFGYRAEQYRMVENAPMTSNIDSHDSSDHTVGSSQIWRGASGSATESVEDSLEPDLNKFSEPISSATSRRLPSVGLCLVLHNLVPHVGLVQHEERKRSALKPRNQAVPARSRQRFG